jgi:hypothetical protein
MVGIMNARERAFSSFWEQKNDAPRHSSSRKCWQSVYATVDLPVLAMPPSQKMGELSSRAHCLSLSISSTRVPLAQGRLASPPLSPLAASASKSAIAVIISR